MTVSVEASATEETHRKEKDLLEHFGKFQYLQYLWICLTLFMVSMTHVNYVFVAENIDYRCRIPKCETSNSTVATPSWWPEDVDSKCYKPILNKKNIYSTNLTCTNDSFSMQIEDCYDWIYENNNSIVSELNLACQPLKVQMVGGIHNTGMIISMIFAGWIADRIGRRPTFILCGVGASIGVFKILLKDYYPYLFIELMESIISSGLYTVGVILLVEIGGPSQRVMAGIIFSYAVYVGEIVFAILAMTLQYWKWLILTIYAPMILFISYFFLLKESPRWQILQGKMEEAKSTLKIIAKTNKIDIADKDLDDCTDEELRSRFDVGDQKQKENLKAIISSKEIMTRLVVAAFCFFASSFLYYGSLVHSVLLPGSKYTNFILAAASSFPGELIAYFTFNKYGRKITLQCGYVVCAVFLIVQSYTPDYLTWVKLSFFLIGKMGVVICFTGIYTYSLELFPTSVRGTLLGFCNTTARVGSMFAPLTPLLMTEVAALPSILFSATAVVAGVLLIFTPETKTLPMFDTIAQIELHKANQSKICTKL
ncbi:unnamed protein product [Arctia plantaginis]|uniref:Major facilitator superfamily (MFS) profile domain-containing protein n=1 Tax=Arctia plantaginis TaxID=874455 RepID=A0A8S0Z2P0_ARCPL|nr:unnamed protein product [Arctia plantaginis]